MTARKASSSKTKKAAPKDPSLKISTFRLADKHRDALAGYALDLGQSMVPPKVVSQTVALQHMILNAKLPHRAAS